MSVRVWQLAAFAYVLVLVLVALEVPLALNLSKRVDAEIKAEAAGSAQLVASSASGRLDRAGELRRLARTASRAVGGRVIVVDGRGRLVADSSGDAAGVPYASRPEIAAALRGSVSQGTRFSRSLGRELLVSAVPILDGGRRAGAVRITQSVDAVRSEVRRDVLALVGLGLGALAIGLLIAWLLAGFLTRPLRSLTATARRVAAGELDARAEQAGAREHREVARAFNGMTERLGRSLVAQRDFVANAAHQLRTPLTGLRLRLESAGLKAADPALRRDLEAGEREAERLARTVTDLLTLAREGGRPALDAPLPLRPAAEEALERWRTVADERGCTLRLDDVARSATAEASAGDVAQILDNLIENAIEHTRPGTTVTVELATEPASVRIAVSDEGPGLAPGEQEAVFERFVRGSSHPGRRGSGLGLTIVRVLAERWGGEASIGNRAGGGARAVVRLPLGAAPSGHGEPALDEALTGEA